MDAIPVWSVFILATIVVLLAIEVGYRLGCAAHRRYEDEKESPVSSMGGATLGLLAFMLAFTFNTVSERFEYRKALVRDEANCIGTARLRSNFLPEPDRSEAAVLFRSYVEDRLEAVASNDAARVEKAVADAERIQDRLWEMAVQHASKDMNSVVAALYVESLNDMIDIHGVRVAVAIRMRIPGGIWLVLLLLLVLAMSGVGYHAGIAGSRRSRVTGILALSFSIVIALIAALDDPTSRFITVSQQPMMDLAATMDRWIPPDASASPRP